MKKLIKKIDRILAKFLIILIRGYQRTLSPDKGILSFYFKGKVCSHEPHCSEYWVRTLARYGFLHWISKVSDRVLHCLPSMQKIYDPEFYKVVFFSSAPIGVPFMQELIQDPRFEVVGVVTQPDKPVGRGLKLQPNIIKSQALELGIPTEDIQTPNRINPEKSIEWKNFFDRLQEKKPDFFVVIAYGKLIPQILLDIPPFGPINVHGSLLPKYRWASPIQSVFLNQEPKTWITIMHMDAGMDTWDIVDQVSFELPFERTCLDCIEHMKKNWPKFLNATLWNYAKDHISRKKQIESEVTSSPKILKEDGVIDLFNERLESVYAKYKGYFLWPKISFELDGRHILIEKLVLDKESYQQYKDLPLITSDFSPNVAVKELFLKPEWKKAMDFASFKNGYLKK